MYNRYAAKDLLELLEEFPAIAIVGPRQVGKTTLAKWLISELKKDCIYLDLENPRDELKLQDPILFFENNMDKCIILDEIQRKKELFPILRSVIDENRVPARFILLGSASPDLIRDSSESLAGRIFYQELTPFHLVELNENFDLNQLFLRGGFPSSLFSKSDAMSFKWRESFVQTYVERDLPLLGLQLDPIEARRILKILSNLNGQLLNYAFIAKSLGLTAPTIKRYVRFLEQAFIIDVLEPYSGNITKRLTKAPKVYIKDCGIANYMLGIQNFNDLLGHPKVGDLWEGFVLQQIKAILPSNIDLCFYRSHNGAEIDFILSFPNNKKIGIEVKFSSVPKLTRGTYEVMSDLNLSHVFVVAPNTNNFMINKDIEVVNCRDLCNTLIEKYFN